MAPSETDEFQRKILLAASATLLVAGLAIYWSWGLLYDTWYPFTRGNIGIYTIFLPLVIFGVLGLLLYRRKPASA